MKNGSETPLVLLLGKNGQLGWELQRCLATLGKILALDYPEIDMAKPGRFCDLIRRLRPQTIINATAYTAVDRAESEIDMAMAINGHAPGILAELACKINAGLIHYSTDYVFDGRKGAPYTESDTPAPLNAYGKSKLAGEMAISQAGGAFLILRTSWVYSLRRDSFVTKVLSWARVQPELHIVADQVGNPTWARMLAEATAQLLAKAGNDPLEWIRERRGLYHLAGNGYASRLEWAEAILRFDPRKDEQVTRAILPAQTSDFTTPAQRPLFSALSCEHFYQTFGLRLPPWEQALELAMQMD